MTSTTAEKTLDFKWLTLILGKINRTFAKIGYARAANELHRLGYYEQARQAILEKQKLS